MKTFIHFFIVGVLIGGAYCGDVECFMNRLSGPLIEIFSDTNGLCSNYQSIFETIRKHIKDCKVDKIKVDGFESMFKEGCTPGSTFMQDFVDSPQCLMAAQTLSLKCMPKVIGTQVSLEAIREECKSLGGVASCINDELGKACSEKTLKVTKTFTGHLDDFYKGLCAEAGGAAANSAILWIMLFGVIVSMMKWQSF